MRRPKRDARLYEKRGYYYAVFYDPHRRPARKWVALETKTRRRAERLLAQMEEARHDGTFDPWRDDFRRQTKIAAAVERYLAHLEAEGLREGSLKWRRDFFRRFAREMPPGALLAHLSAEDVRRYCRRRPAQGSAAAKGRLLSAHTQRTYYAQLRAFLSWCVDERLIDANPAHAVQRPKAPPRPPIDHLTPEELEHLLATVDADVAAKQARRLLRGPYARQLVWIKDVIVFAAGTGLRLGELRRLRWQDIDRARRVLYVRNTELGETKTGEERSVPIVSFVAEVLDRQAALRANEDPAGTVFVSPRGGPLSAETTSRLFRKYRRLAGLPEGISFHSLRKTTGTWLASRGVPMQVIQRVLGHANVAITSTTYADVWQETLHREVERAIGSLRSPAAGSSLTRRRRRR